MDRPRVADAKRVSVMQEGWGSSLWDSRLRRFAILYGSAVQFLTWSFESATRRRKSLARDAKNAWENAVMNGGCGRIAMIVPKDSDIELSPNLSGLRSAIDVGSLKHFAIANPDHAPYGRAAREALKSMDLWQAIQPFLIKGENASQATQFAVSGSSEGGIVPYSLAMSPAIARLSDNMPIAESHHQPIRQHMVLLRGAGAVAVQFFEFLGEAEAIAFSSASIIPWIRARVFSS